MTIIFEDSEIRGPATHALVIGVGAYPFLPGGAGSPTTTHDDGMRQLSSPPVSARRFADWLVADFDHPDRPLASVDLLLGEADRRYRPPPRPGNRRPQRRRVDEPLVDAIAAAAARLKALGDRHPDSQLIFYFCGHGISSGTEFALVAADYGSVPRRPHHGLIDFTRFLIGMSDCAAMRQCYFIDACRATTESLIASRNYAGDELVTALRPQTPGLRQSVYYSTLGGAPAHGRPGEPSLFTMALLLSLTGAAAANTNGAWWINTTRLLEALNHLMEHVVDPAVPIVQVPQSGTQSQFDLHRLPHPPEIPLHIPVRGHVGADPPDDVELGVSAAGRGLACYPAAEPPLERPLDWRWRHFEAWLEAGLYDVAYARPSGAAPPVDRRCFVSPPGHRLEL